MKLAVVADAHLGGPGGSAGPLVEQLRSLPDAGCERLILLGDLFQAWIGFPAFETADIRAVVETLCELRRRGLRVDYVEGNRDFFLAGSRYADAFDSIGAETTAESNGRRLLFVHGDGLNDRDRAYLFWRWLSKSGAVRLLVRCLPGAVARRFVASTERRLADTNFKHKIRIPERAIRAYGERRLRDGGFDCLVLGHFHEPHRLAVAGGEVVLLEAWFSSRRLEAM